MTTVRCKSSVLTSYEPPERFLLITADDFGIGPETSRGILELAARGFVTSAVLLINSPFAAESVVAWRGAGRPMELGWHPCLTLDRPLLSPTCIPSLVDSAGSFHRLGAFLVRLATGRIKESEVEAEFHAQLGRFIELVGHPPANVNVHHHLHVFGRVGNPLCRVLGECPQRPYLRRVVEPVMTWKHVHGARVKRAVLSWFGRWAATNRQGEFPGNDTLIGVTDPPYLAADDFYTRWLAIAAGRVIELSCHPGHFDPSLVGRDGTLINGQIQRRPRELELLHHPDFRSAVMDGGFKLVTAADVAGRMSPRPSLRGQPIGGGGPEQISSSNGHLAFRNTRG